ncbi:lipopolysaccharide heptosyltransferase family protein [Mucilaginibacter limnophilus]|uniref:Lipopolysaccharide heptosyltransferase family protein n=1 Tax=Mucilaginibacter limnophilus TaxID=1932778 RepID=A0A3S2UMA1_9SPHI|nr:glycosyltransferase family 9 protein [Mucilaginibacter limnophilus]RVU01809.1 lipopolysaccharide heptosyltransferase family protein [Mucilaginibacter limnophilus]
MTLPAKTHILISRTDAIGDVVLTLPMCGYIKSVYPNAVISFLGRTYTGPVIKACAMVDHFINYDEMQKLPEPEMIRYLQDKNIDIVLHVFPNKHVAKLARKARIKTRIGTTNRPYHWLTCNKLVKLSRKKSNLHEAQLNMVLLRPLNMAVPELAEIPKYYQFKPAAEVPAQLKQILTTDKFNLILHPKSHGSGVEWGINNFAGLIDLLPAERFNIIITGSEKEKDLLNNWLKQQPEHVIDVTGQMNLDEFIAFIHSADGLVASGTGPLHIAAACGINTLGLFPNTRPIHPQRWAPLGLKANFIESDSGSLQSITPEMVAQKINQWKK